MADDEVTDKPRRRGGFPKGTKIKKIPVDWAKAQLRYITGGNITKEKVAEEFGVPAGRLRKRAVRECWDDNKKNYCDGLATRVLDAKVDDAVEELKLWNNGALQEAKYLREAARRQYMRKLASGEWKFNTDVSSRAIQAAAAANVAADKLARLALGASTDNTNNLNRSLPASVDDFV